MDANNLVRIDLRPTHAVLAAHLGRRAVVRFRCQLEKVRTVHGRRAGLE